MIALLKFDILKQNYLIIVNNIQDKGLDSMNFIAKTDIGALRERNEDSYFFDDENRLFAIADGMSGHARGDIASQLTLQVFEEWAAETPNLASDLGPIKRLDILEKLATDANRRVYAMGQDSYQYHRMGTTLTAGFVTPSYLAYVHVGDSRLYVLHNDVLTQITTDDSLVQQMIEKGEITPEEGRVHAKRNIITQAIGLAEEVSLTTDVCPLSAGDIILACTDGLHDLIIDDTETRNIISSAPTLEAASENLISKALAYGGTDNVTVLLTTVD